MEWIQKDAIFFPVLMAPAGAIFVGMNSEMTWKRDGFLNSFHPDVKWFIQRIEWIIYKIGRMSVLFNNTHLKEKMLHINIYIHTHIYIYIIVCYIKK